MTFTKQKSLLKLCLGLFILSSVALTGCGSDDVVKSGDVNESKIWRQYRVTYSENTQATDIFAQFRVGGPTGTTVSLEKPSAISVVDSDMKLTGTDPREISSFGSGYGWNLSGTPASQSYTFKWTKQSGAVTTDIVSMPAKPAMAMLYNSKFNLPQGITIALDQEAQNAGGRISATITGQDKISHETISTYKSITSGYTITFTPEEVASFAAGTASLIITTDTEKSASGGESGSLGGKTFGSYLKKPVDITLTR